MRIRTDLAMESGALEQSIHGITTKTFFHGKIEETRVSVDTKEASLLLEKAMGSDAFHAFLKDWYTEHSLKIVTTRDFIYELLAVDHSEAVQAVLTKYLSTYTEMVEEAKAS